MVIFLLCAEMAAMGQDNVSSLPLTADSLASGNFKDLLTSSLQLAADHFTSNNKQLCFTSNPFAIMSRMDSSLLVDTNYIRYTHLRNLNFSFSGMLDSAYHFNGFSSGITYALINQRDETVSRAFLAKAAKADAEFTNLNLSMSRYISTLLKQDHAKAIKQNDQIDSLFKGLLTYNKIDPDLQKLMKDSARQLNAKNFLTLLDKDPKLNIHNASFQTYDSLRNLFRKCWLWTVGLSDTTFNNRFLFSNVVLATEVLKGINDPSHTVGIELDLKGSYHFTEDTMTTSRSLQRQILNIEPGLNFVFTTKKTNYSWAEFKISGQYSRIYKGGYNNEKTDSLTINGTIRIRVTKNIWVPLEIKYDPRSGNIFGFLNVRCNFSALGSSAKKPVQ